MTCLGLFRILLTVRTGHGTTDWFQIGKGVRQGIKEISSEYSLKGLMLKLELQYFGQLIQRTDSLEKTLMLGKIKDGKRRGRQRMRQLDGIHDSMDVSLSEL